MRNRDWKIDIHVSRSAAFHSATLVVAGIFLLGLSAVGEVFRYLGAGWSGVAEISLVFAGMSGSALADIGGIGRIEIDAMRNKGFKPAFASAVRP